MGFLTCLLIISLILWIFKKCNPSARLREYGDRIPGPKSYPIIGNGFVFLTSKTLVQTLDELCTHYGPVLRLWLGKKLWVCLSDPADIAVFLSSTKHLNKSDIYRLLDSWLGNKGLVTSNGEVWRTHRKLLTPSFNFKIVENSVPIMHSNALVLCEQLQREANKSEFDIQQYLEKCSFDIICEIGMGIKLNTQASRSTPYLDSLIKLRNSAVQRMFQTWLHPEFIFQMTNCGKMYYDKLRIIKQEVEKVILVRRKMLENEIGEELPQNESKTNGTYQQAKPFLDFMLSAGTFTNEEIENEVQTFMFAGQDTTMTTMAFCLYLLSKHPEIQEECVKEIKSLVSEGIKLTYADYKNFKYLDNVIKETLRIYTTVPLIARQVDEDVLLPSGYLLPAGSLVNFNLLHMHNNEQYFPNAKQFNPKRFDDRKSEKENHYSYLPFSAGPRNCLGQKFAMLEMKVVLTETLLRYKFLPADKTKELTIETGIVLRSLENMPVRISRRE